MIDWGVHVSRPPFVRQLRQQPAEQLFVPPPLFPPTGTLCFPPSSPLCLSPAPSRSPSHSYWLPSCRVAALRAAVSPGCALLSHLDFVVSTLARP